MSDTIDRELNEFVDEIKSKLNIKGGVYTDAELEGYVAEVPKERYLEFFTALSGDEFSYKSSLDRVKIIAHRFMAEKEASLFSGVREKAKAMYDKFYHIHASMTSFSQANRDLVPNDRTFFEDTDYSEMRRVDNSLVFDEQEIYVLDKLGGGEWIMNIKFFVSAKEPVDAIERIMKSAITRKYLTPKHAAISSDVKKLIGKDAA